MLSERVVAPRKVSESYQAWFGEFFQEFFAHTKRRSGLADATVLDVLFDGEDDGVIAEVENGREQVAF
jgi:hypothetical protein